MEMACESLHTQSPLVIYAARKKDETDINYVWLSSSVMFWNGSLVMFFCIFYFPEGITFKHVPIYVLYYSRMHT